MDKEQRKRMAIREFVGAGIEPDVEEISYAIKVSGDRVELHREWEEPWENESGTGQDIGHDCWLMSVSDLKQLVECSAWALQKSEAFEIAHPAVKVD